MQVYNHDICGYIRKIDRICMELHKCTSANTSEFSSFDIARLESYLGALTAYSAWMQAEPRTEWPESHPQTFEVPELIEYPQVENESVNDMIRLLSLAKTELVNSQSARNPSHLNEFDYIRQQSYVAKITSLLNNYVKTATPLDLIESSPRDPMSGPGITGV